MEQWEIIEDFENYEVSNLGRVRRLTPGKRTSVGRILKLRTTHKSGYVMVGLHKDKKRHFKSVHVLVARAFIPNPLNLPEVNHKRNKTDCRAVSLEWRSKRGNELDKMLKGSGVSLDKRSGKYRACYSPSPYTRVWLGRFPTRHEAEEARNKAIESLPHTV
jgi:hypothetical protein